MGRFLNPDNSAFQAALNANIYVDKTDFIEYTNRVIGSIDAFIPNEEIRQEFLKVLKHRKWTELQSLEQQSLGFISV